MQTGVILYDKRGFCNSPLPKFIDPVFAITSPKRSFSITENERFVLIFAKTVSINSGTVQCGPERIYTPRNLGHWAYAAVDEY